MWRMHCQLQILKPFLSSEYFWYFLFSRHFLTESNNPTHPYRFHKQENEIYTYIYIFKNAPKSCIHSEYSISTICTDILTEQLLRFWCLCPNLNPILPMIWLQNSVWFLLKHTVVVERLSLSTSPLFICLLNCLRKSSIKIVCNTIKA